MLRGVAIHQPDKGELRGVFNAPNKSEAERQLEQMVHKYVAQAPQLSDWLESNVPEGLNRKLKRRTRVASLFPNPESLQRLATALLMESADGWQSEKRYLSRATE